MYTQTFFVTSVRAIFLPPQIFANGSLSVFGAKSPTPFFFMAAATFLPLALLAALPGLLRRLERRLRRLRNRRLLRLRAH